MQTEDVQSRILLVICRLVNEQHELKCKLEGYTGEQVLWGQEHSYTAEKPGGATTGSVAGQHLQVCLWISLVDGASDRICASVSPFTVCCLSACSKCH